MKFPKEACKLFLERQFGQDLVFPIYKWIVPSPKNRDQLVEWVDRWVDDPKGFVDPIGSWDTSKITDFTKAVSAYRNPKLADFDEELNWDTSNATTLAFMFYECKAFTGKGVKYWKVHNVTDMSMVFGNCYVFIGDVSGWDTSSATLTRYMFWNCRLFDGDLSQWNVHNVEYMQYMFCNCWLFNSDISGWDTSNVVDMQVMFSKCHAFDASLEQWDVSSATTVQNMFYDCKSFDRACISQWNLSDNVVDAEYMFTKDEEMIYI